MEEQKDIEGLLRHLGRVLAAAMSRSEEVTSSLRKAHEEGYSLFLILEDRERGERGVQIELRARDVPEPAAAPTQASFRLDGTDVRFLQSIGIDATRTGRRRRT
ncbi:MAG: hypothetical protein AAGN66_23835 [Acidobacteriota bacterium]